MANTLEAIKFSANKLEILNQLKLPEEFLYEDCSNTLKGWEAIQQMKVRGAPAIAITAALCLASEVSEIKKNISVSELKNYIFEKLDYLCTSRPTAVNLFKMSAQMKEILNKEFHSKSPDCLTTQEFSDFYIAQATALLAKDIADNKAIGEFGAQCFAQSSAVKILTHCNTGSLATAGYGTALGVIRSLHAHHKLAHAYATETRPYNQGARLTAFELVFEKIPATLITDSMAAFLMQQKKIDGVIVGADRVVANGDTANKIGTYQLAIAAAYHKIPFYVAAPSTSIDCAKHTGAEITIEERPKQELTHIHGKEISAPGIGVWNPSFDITPAELITGIITEVGVITKVNGLFPVTEFLTAKINTH